jgi:hypothetical protein
METIDDETIAGAQDFIARANGAGTPFFVWMNTTHMHLRTHPKPESVGQAGRWQSPYQRADQTSNTYYDWFLDNDYLALAATAIMTEFLATFKDFPPRQRPASFTIDQAVEKPKLSDDRPLRT